MKTNYTTFCVPHHGKPELRTLSHLPHGIGLRLSVAPEKVAGQAIL
jgi:DNA-binding phage protein